MSEAPGATPREVDQAKPRGRLHGRICGGVSARAATLAATRPWLWRSQRKCGNADGPPTTTGERFSGGQDGCSGRDYVVYQKYVDAIACARAGREGFVHVSKTFYPRSADLGGGQLLSYERRFVQLKTQTIGDTFCDGGGLVISPIAKADRMQWNRNHDRACRRIIRIPPRRVKVFSQPMAAVNAQAPGTVEFHGPVQFRRRTFSLVVPQSGGTKDTRRRISVGACGGQSGHDLARRWSFEERLAFRANGDCVPERDLPAPKTCSRKYDASKQVQRAVKWSGRATISLP